MLGKLLPCAGGPPIPLLKPVLLVGRHRTCDVAISYPAVSARHCELALRDGYWSVRDLDSSNGTRVNDTACKENWLLPNDILDVARYRYTIAYFPPPNCPPPHRAGPPAQLPESVVRQAETASAAAVPTPTPESVFGELVPCGGGAPIRLTQPKLVVGRIAGCDIVLPFGPVSSRHCQLEWTGGHWVVHDLDSRNGTRVDGVRCKSQRLLPGAVLGIASLRYRVVYTPSAPGPAFAKSLLEEAGLTRWGREQLRTKPKPDDEDDGALGKFTLDEDLE